MELSSLFEKNLKNFFLQSRLIWMAFTGQPFAASNTRKNRSFAGWESTVDTRPMT